MALLSEGASRPLVPDDFQVPATLETPRFRLRMLSIHDVVRDFEAVVSSRDHLHEVFGPGWPDGLTLEQNLVDLGWHQKEFQDRRSFAYTVVAPDESRVLGCVYLYPPRKAGCDVEVYFWARQDELESGLEQELETALTHWLAERWPFQQPAFPGRDIPAAEWAAQPGP